MPAVTGILGIQESYPRIPSILSSSNISGQYQPQNRMKVFHMGSSVARKSNDRPVINRPKSNSSVVGTGGGIGSDAQPVDINNVCPLAFDTKLSNQTVSIGTKLILDKQLLKTVAGTIVGQLTTLQHKIVKQCAGMGYAYNYAEVVDKKGVRYAEIKR